MKKYLPLIIVGVVVVIGLVVFILVKSLSSQTPVVVQDAVVPDLPQAEWPMMALIPTSNPQVPGSDGHWLDFKVQKITVPGAASMDYELIYNTGSGGQQGVPGTVKLDGTDVDRPLLLGSESSGKFRYDVGVEQGTMTIRFRDGSGKLIGKLSTTFHLQSNTVDLSSADNNLKYTLAKLTKNVFFVTMQTFKDPDASMVVFTQNGYSIFASDGKPHAGKVVTQ